MDDLAQAITEEMGAPLASVSRPMQAPAGLGHFKVAMAVLKEFEFERPQGATRIVREPIGVVGMITPWNWPVEPDRLQGRTALAAGLHHGAEAERDGAAVGACDHRDPARGGRAEGRVQPREWRRTRRSAPRSPRTRAST